MAGESEYFCYSEESYIQSTELWNTGQPMQLSDFDKKLLDGWNNAMDNGIFRYRMDQLRTRVIPGPHRFVLQLNELRGTERRKPDYIDHVRQPFNPDKFNFTKVKKEEILFELCPCRGRNKFNGKDSATNSTNGFDFINGEKEESKARHVVMVNVSPLEYGHVLLVPSIDSCLPQVLTEKAIQLSIEMLLLSAHRGFRVGYNSLCAYASVNHQHVHGWYLEHELAIETLPVKEIGGVCHLLEEWPAPCFVFQLHGSTVTQLTRSVHTVMSYLQDNDIAHNLFITRGTVFGDSSTTTVRVLLWPRILVKGAKNEFGIPIFNPAVAELGGHVPMYIKEKFEELKEEDIISMIKDNLLPNEEFETIVNAVIKLLPNQDPPVSSVDQNIPSLQNHIKKSTPTDKDQLLQEKSL